MQITKVYFIFKCFSFYEKQCSIFLQLQFNLQAKAHLTELQDLQDLLTETEDKLTDSKLEVTKLKNSLVDQKTNYEIQLCDVQTKLNEVRIMCNIDLQKVSILNSSMQSG